MAEKSYFSQQAFPCGCVSLDWCIKENLMKDTWKRDLWGIYRPPFPFNESVVKIHMTKMKSVVVIRVYQTGGVSFNGSTLCRIFFKDCSGDINYEVKSLLVKKNSLIYTAPTFVIPISDISNDGEETGFDRFVTVSCVLKNLANGVHEPCSHFRTQTESAEKRFPNEQKDADSQTQTINIPTQTGEIQAASNICKLQQDYKKLSETPEEGDVCLKVGEREFRAHKCILRARSTVFDAMFKHGMKEAVSGEVVIQDLDAHSFPVFLEHLYAGSASGLSESNACNLFTAADKYDMQELKAECKTFIKQTLSTDTFCDLMDLAIKHQDEELLSLAVDFFSKNMSQIIQTVKWQNFQLAHTIEANELLIKSLGSKEE